MAIHMTAEYRVKPESVDACLGAVSEFVAAVARSEPGARHYAVWQDDRDPVHFFHHFVFDDEAAEAQHRESPAVRRLTSTLVPETVSGMHFTRYREVASCHHRHDHHGGAA